MRLRCFAKVVFPEQLAPLCTQRHVRLWLTGSSITHPTPTRMTLVLSSTAREPISAIAQRYLSLYALGGGGWRDPYPVIESKAEQGSRFFGRGMLSKFPNVHIPRYLNNVAARYLYNKNIIVICVYEIDKRYKSRIKPKSILNGLILRRPLSPSGFIIAILPPWLGTILNRP